MRHSGPRHRVGGPSTLQGVEFQIEYCVKLGLSSFIDHLRNPLSNPSITVEAREVTQNLSLGWDVYSSRENERFELKTRPSNEDVSKWLTQIKKSAETSIGFVLAFSDADESVRSRIRMIERWADIARESLTLEDFHQRVLFEERNIEEAGKGILTDAHWTKWKQLRCDCKTQDALESHNGTNAHVLAGVASNQFLNFLRRDFLKAGTKRLTRNISSLLSDVKKDGILLAAPTAIPKNINETKVSILFLLSKTVAPCPLIVLSNTLGVSEKVILDEVRPLSAQNIVSMNDGSVKLCEAGSMISVSSEKTLIRTFLNSFISFFKTHAKHSSILESVSGLVSLMRYAERICPEEVAMGFAVLDKPVKRLGKKKLMLEVANISIRAARISVRTNEVIREEARALICGRAWVYQRRDELADAEAAANTSKLLSIDISDKEMEAFCHKCIGRLHRMSAEKTDEPREKENGFEQSKLSLKNAIDSFSAIGKSAEVGDCFSLLARTLYEQKKYPDAEHYFKKAADLIVNPEDKDFFDLSILEGDIKYARGAFKNAIKCYSLAIDSCNTADALQNEILARAYFRRGLSWKHILKRSARRDFLKAIEIWTTLEEMDNAAKAEWELAQLNPRISKKVLEWLSGVPLIYDRVLMLKVYLERLQRTNSVAIARRTAAPTTAEWRDIRVEAMSKKHRESPQW